MKKTLLALCLFVVAASFSSILAETEKIGLDGTLHKIAVVNLNGSTEAYPKTYLLHTLQKPDGTVEKYTIPLTGDSLPDLDPQLEINPMNQMPIIVWSRFDGTDFEIAMSAFAGTYWLQPKILTSNLNNDREPIIIAESSSFFHMMWKEETPGIPTYYHLNVSTIDYGLANPEILYVPTENLVLPDGTTPPTSIFPTEQSNFFAFALLSPAPKRMVVWGGRDDPSPITYQEGFRLPDTIQYLSNLHAQKVNGKLTIIFRSGDKLYYMYRTLMGWTPFRVVKLDTGMHEGKAELLIKEMIQRLPQ